MNATTLYDECDRRHRIVAEAKAFVAEFVAKTLDAIPADDEQREKHERVSKFKGRREHERGRR